MAQANLDPKEVSQVAWLDISQVIELLKHDSSWFSYGYDINMLEAIRDEPYG